MSLSDYISLISEQSSRYGDKLLDLMDRCGVGSLAEVTLAQAKEYYETRCMNHAIAG